MRTVNLCATALFVGLLVPIGSAFGQHNWQRTITVDPTAGAADWTTIQLGINDPKIGNDPTVRYTVLIFAGTYMENVTLGGLKENVDLVGIDRYSVIIAPTSAGSGIKITSGNETSRNNLIANLTIITDDGHGIEIVKGIGGSDKTPKDIQIEGVTILAAGATKDGIEGSDADTVRIFDCNIDSAANDGVTVGHNFELIDTVVTALDGRGVYGNAKDGLRLRGCKIKAETDGLHLAATPENVEVYGSEIIGGGTGVFFWNGANIIVEGCHILGDGSLISTASTSGVFVDGFNPLAGDITFVGCQIEAIGDDTGHTTGVHHNTDASATVHVRLVDCDISAVGTDSVSGDVYGVGPNGAITIIGGSIETSASAEKETEVWDLSDGPFGTIRISGTTFSKAKGPIFTASRPRSVIQRTISVGVADDDAILSSLAGGLTGSEHDVTPGGQPDVYRVLSITGNKAGMDQDVYIIGTDWGDNVIVDKIKLNGTSPRDGVKPFKTVTKIILPVQNSCGETVKVGVINKLGLYYPISATTDVLQQGRKASGASSYTLETSGWTPEAVYATVDITTITAGDSFEWALLTGE